MRPAPARPKSPEQKPPSANPESLSRAIKPSAANPESPARAVKPIAKPSAKAKEKETVKEPVKPSRCISKSSFSKTYTKLKLEKEPEEACGEAAKESHADIRKRLKTFYRKEANSSQGNRPGDRPLSRKRKEKEALKGEEYRLERELGTGSYSRVMLGRNGRGEEVAIKIYEKRQLLCFSRRSSYYSEVEVLGGLDHKNVISLVDTYSTRSQLCLVMDYVEGVSLEYLVREAGKLPEGVCCGLFRQLVEALAYIHGKGIAHRDVKASNIIVNEDYKLKLIDFGFAQQVAGLDSRLLCGTPSYMAPELLGRQKASPEKADVWAAGVVLFLMLAGRQPFQSSQPSDLHRLILKGELAFPEGISYEARRVCRMLLERDPAARPTAEQVARMNWLR
jgi:hypothetical protein